MLARFPRFPAHPPVGLTQRMSQHNIKAPLKKRPMVAPTGMVGTQNYSVGASIARPPSCGLTGKANRLHTQPPLRSYDLRQKPRHDGRPMVAPTGMVGTQIYNVGASIARPSPLPPLAFKQSRLPDGCGGNSIRAAQPHTSIIHYTLFTIHSQAQPAPLSPQTLQPKCNQKNSQKRLKPAVAYAIIKKNMFGEDFGPNSSVFDKTFSTQYL